MSRAVFNSYFLKNSSKVPNFAEYYEKYGYKNMLTKKSVKKFKNPRIFKNQPHFYKILQNLELLRNF